ncbi:MAG: DUF2500 domain-containing protein [Defluviitaleaceae bacterium]|nr:DUF2500 domain-containing protein [Defluviitaleaceae bacterium]
MITQSEYKLKLRKAWAVLCFAIATCILIIAVAAYGINQAIHSPESWIISYFFFTPVAAIVVFTTAIISMTGGIIWLIIKGLLGTAEFKEKSNRYLKATEHRDYACAISKMVQQPVADSDDETTYYISFEFLDGQRKSFTVDALQYNVIFEGEMGLLTYKQNGEHLFFGDFRFQRQR